MPKTTGWNKEKQWDMDKTETRRRRRIMYNALDSLEEIRWNINTIYKSLDIRASWRKCLPVCQRGHQETLKGAGLLHRRTASDDSRIREVTGGGK